MISILDLSFGILMMVFGFQIGRVMGRNDAMRRMASTLRQGGVSQQQLDSWLQVGREPHPYER